MNNVLFLMGSPRENGNSEQLARLAAHSLKASAAQRWLRLHDLPLEPFIDQRHSLGVYPAPSGNAQTLFEATLAASDIVMVAPLYWYSLPSGLKRYLDEWSAWLRVPDAQFKSRMAGKTMWAICCSSGDPEDAEPMLASLRLSARYMGMNWGGHVLGNGSKPGEVLNDHAALRQARQLFGGT